MSRLVEFLGLRRSMAGLLAMVVLVGMGEHMAERFLPLYLQKLAAGTTGILAIGVLAFLDDFLSALYSFPGGYLAERLGHKRALLVFNLISMVGYLIVIFVRQWWAVLVGAALFISWSAISLPAMMELIAGEDLSQRIARGAILIDEALPIAKQIADAGVDRPAVENQRAARSLSTGRCAADPGRSVNGKDACATTTCVGVRGQLSSAERPPGPAGAVHDSRPRHLMTSSSAWRVRPVDCHVASSSVA